MDKANEFLDFKKDEVSLSFIYYIFDSICLDISERDTAKNFKGKNAAKAIP
jgi:hypothetical protein